MLSLPWSVVTALRLEPVGPINADVLGLRYHAVDALWTTATYRVAEPRRLRQFREALGSLVDSPTGLRRPDKTPFYTALCNVHRCLTEEGT